MRLGGSGICCVKIFFVKYTLLFDTSVRLGFVFFGQVRLGFSLVKSFAEDSVPCFISVCLGLGGGWEEEGLLCVSSLRVSVALCFPFCPLFLELPAGTPWNRLVSFEVFFPSFYLHCFLLETRFHRRRTSTF